MIGVSTSAAAWWGSGPWGNSGYGDDWGDGWGDVFGDFSMSAGGRGSGYGRGRGYDCGYAIPTTAAMALKAAMAHLTALPTVILGQWLQQRRQLQPSRIA